MVYSIQRHEVDRLVNVLVALGWELKDEKFENGALTLVVYRKLPDDLLKAAAALEKVSGSL